mgnify:CR=1 FL=1
MRIVKRILLGVGIVLLALVLFAVGSVAVDALVQKRVLTATRRRVILEVAA